MPETAAHAALNSRQIPGHVPNSRHAATSMAHFRGSRWVYFTRLCSKYPNYLSSFSAAWFCNCCFFFLTATLDQKMVIKMRRCITVIYFREVESKKKNNHKNTKTTTTSVPSVSLLFNWKPKNTFTVRSSGGSAILLSNAWMFGAISRYFSSWNMWWEGRKEPTYKLATCRST